MHYNIIFYTINNFKIIKFKKVSAGRGFKCLAFVEKSKVCLNEL